MSTTPDTLDRFETSGPTDVVEQFLDGEPVAPDALVAALATAEGREHLRATLELRALMADVPPAAVSGASAPAERRWPSLARIAAMLVLATMAAAAGYGAGIRRADVADVADVHVETAGLAPAAEAAPAPTTVIKLDANNGWQDRTGGF